MSAASVGEILADDLRIPHYQRPYVWEPDTALQLFEDIQDAQELSSDHDDTDQTSPYVLGAIILHSNDGALDIVDGQQRLLTLRMILSVLDTESDQPSPSSGASPVALVRRALSRAVAALTIGERRNLANYTQHHCRLVRVVTDDVDEAFRVFDSQNYRGKPLAPHDLLKAHHLREMRDETEGLKAAVVESWEAAGDSELDQLFSVYLYRIARWSRGQSAPAFTSRDIVMFKGISPRNAQTPSARYHVAAQSVLPMLNSWGTPGGAIEDRAARHSRFQLDAPILAGRSFFEMVAFMLAEVRRLRALSLPSGSDSAASGSDALTTWIARSRYRKVTELYLAAVLYYTNKFGSEDLRASEAALVVWAYHLRVGLLRVQQVSIDNLARGEKGPSAFVLMRNADEGRAVQRLAPSLQQARVDHETELFERLTKLGVA